MKLPMFVFAAAIGLAPAWAQSPPQPLPMPPATPAAQDKAYPGALTLYVDATDTARRIFNIRETIPVQGGGRVTLLYPEWLPGNHAPRGQIEKIGGLKISASGKRLEWTRDTVDVYAFHVDVPAGVNVLDVEFQFLSAVEGNQGRIVVTPEMMNVQWNSMALYPAGYFTRQIPVNASIKLPESWQFGTALETASSKDGVTAFKTVSFETLVDSPMFAGLHFLRVPLTNDRDPRPVHLNIVADNAEFLQIKPEHVAAHKALIVQAQKLYGSQHYSRYEFLLALTDKMGGIGLEHQQSSENATLQGYFTGWDKSPDARDLLPHEYTHSWNGKFRRPADLWTPNFNVPMRNSLLWVYEGQTQYWGEVLAARSGLVTAQDALDSLALTASTYDERVGREWKALQDTTNDPITNSRRPQAWRTWQRSEDYYQEGQLIWLDADTLIREKSNGRKSLDDFAKAFFGVDDGSTVTHTYTFEDVVKALNQVQAYDWAAFLRARLDGHGPGGPLDGVARGGYRLVYGDEPSEFLRKIEAREKSTLLLSSLGMLLDKGGKITSVQWGSPAFDKSLTVGTQIVAVNGLAYEADAIKKAIVDAKTSKAPVELIVSKDGRYRTVPFAYFEGLRYPKLEKVAKAPLLDEIFKAK